MIMKIILILVVTSNLEVLHDRGKYHCSNIIDRKIEKSDLQFMMFLCINGQIFRSIWVPNYY